MDTSVHPAIDQFSYLQANSAVLIDIYLLFISTLSTVGSNSEHLVSKIKHHPQITDMAPTVVAVSIFSNTIILVVALLLCYNYRGRVRNKATLLSIEHIIISILTFILRLSIYHYDYYGYYIVVIVIVILLIEKLKSQRNLFFFSHYHWHLIFTFWLLNKPLIHGE